MPCVIRGYTYTATGGRLPTCRLSVAGYSGAMVYVGRATFDGSNAQLVDQEIECRQVTERVQLKGTLFGWRLTRRSTFSRPTSEAVLESKARTFKTPSRTFIQPAT